MKLELKCFKCKRELTFTEEDVKNGSYILCNECLKTSVKKKGRRKGEK